MRQAGLIQAPPSAPWLLYHRWHPVLPAVIKAQHTKFYHWMLLCRCTSSRQEWITLNACAFARNFVWLQHTSTIAAFSAPYLCSGGDYFLIVLQANEIIDPLTWLIAEKRFLRQATWRSCANRRKMRFIPWSNFLCTVALSIRIYALSQPWDVNHFLSISEKQ